MAADNSSKLPLVCVNNENTVGKEVVTKKVPHIIEDIIKHVKTDFKEIDQDCLPEEHKDFKSVVKHMKKIIQEIEENAVFRPLQDSYPDALVWNYYIDERTQKNSNTGPTFYEVELFFAEAYTYRRAFEAFQLTYTMREYDYFRSLKTAALLASSKAIDAMCDHMEDIRPTIKEKSDADQFEHFVDFAESTVWGNKCDMTLTAGKVIKPSDHPLEQLKKLRSNFVRNDLKDIWQCLNDKGPKGKKRIAYITDNSGMEIFTDLLFLDFLQTISVCRYVTIFIKAYPWFVSDVNEFDFDFTLKTLMNSPNPSCNRLGAYCLDRLRKHLWKTEKCAYFTTPFPYCDMQKRDPDLYTKLSRFDLLIFKGDLNGRKLLGDKVWERSTPFENALQGFKPTNVCNFRAIKCESVAGLTDEKKLKKLDKGDAEWLTSGNYAVICLAKK